MSVLEAKSDVSLSEEQIQEIQEAFTLFDTDSDNKIDARELKVALNALDLEITNDDITKLMNRNNINYGYISFD